MPSIRSRSGRAGTDRSAADLLRSAAAGEEEAWREIVRRYERLVWSVLATSGLDPATMADVHQTVWLRLCEHAGRIRDPDRLASWLVTTARREAARLRRERSRLLLSADGPADAPDHGTPEPVDHLVDAELRAQVRAALRDIDETSRRTLHLLYGGARPGYRHIAEQTGRPLGSIGPTRARALAKMRRRLEGTVR